MFNRLLQMLDGMIDADFAVLPNFTFRTKLRDTLYNAGFNKQTVDTFVLTMKVELTSKLSDAQVDELVARYAAVYIKMHAMLAGSCWEGIRDVEERFRTMISMEPLSVSFG